VSDVTVFLVVTDGAGKFLCALRNEKIFRRSLDITYSSCKDVKIAAKERLWQVTTWTVDYLRPAAGGYERHLDTYRTVEHRVEVLDEPEHF
jgi:hypothetical protein